MPTILLDHPVPLPVRVLEAELAKAVPGWRWRAGDDIGAESVALERPTTILGKYGEALVIMTVELSHEPLPLETGAPPHRCRLDLSEPSTDNAELAGRIALVTAAAVLHDHEGHAQIAAEGPWCRSAELKLACKAITADAAARVDECLAGLGTRSSAPATLTEPTASPQLEEAGPAPATAESEPPDAVSGPDPLRSASPQVLPPVFPRRAGGFGRRGV